VLDVYAELVAYASARHGNLVRPDDIRTMMTTVFINLSKNSGGNANAAGRRTDAGGDSLPLAGPQVPSVLRQTVVPVRPGPA
jgi:hypothetical protein